mgnify:FL=1
MQQGICFMKPKDKLNITNPNCTQTRQVEVLTSDLNDNNELLEILSDSFGDNGDHLKNELAETDNETHQLDSTRFLGQTALVESESLVTVTESDTLHEAIDIEDSQIIDTLITNALRIYKENPKFVAKMQKLRTKKSKPVKSPEQKHHQDVGSYELLSKERERTLFKELDKGLKSMFAGTASEEEVINTLVAHQTLFLSNLRLALKFAHKKTRLSGLDLYDLTQAGYEGLYSAVNRFKLDYDVKFSTYAAQWIKNRIQRFADESNNSTYAPRLVREKYNRISRFKNNLEHKLQREPTDEELSAELGCSVEEIGALLSNQALKQTVSLDAPVSRTDKNYRLLDSLDNGDDSEQEQIIKNIDEAKTLNLIFNSHYISKTEKYILSLRYGVWSEDLVGTSVEFKNGTEIKYEELSELISSGESTLDTVGQLFGVTRERIRQIQKKAERKIYKSYRHAKNA